MGKPNEAESAHVGGSSERKPQPSRSHVWRRRKSAAGGKAAATAKRRQNSPLRVAWERALDIQRGIDREVAEANAKCRSRLPERIATEEEVHDVFEDLRRQEGWKVSTELTIDRPLHDAAGNQRFERKLDGLELILRIEAARRRGISAIVSERRDLLVTSHRGRKHLVIHGFQLGRFRARRRRVFLLRLRDQGANRNRLIRQAG